MEQRLEARWPPQSASKGPAHAAALAGDGHNPAPAERDYGRRAAWCAVVAAHKPAATDLALLFAQISSRWAGLQDQIVLETRSAPQVRLAQRSLMAQHAWPNGPPAATQV